jgi:exodeoxyribonuclease V gamma subunit
MRRPLRFSVEAACAWLKAMSATKKPPTEEDGREAVRKAHESETGQAGRGRSDAYLARAWPDFDAFWDDGEEFKRWAHGLLGPLRAHLGEPPKEAAKGDAA